MSDRIFRALFVLYLVAFAIFLFAPLLVMAAAAFNTSRFPTVIPWQGTTLEWFRAMWNDAPMWDALWTSAVIAVAVVVVSLPIGTAAALVLTSLHARARSFAYAVMVSPLLTPGVVIGIATLILWRQVGVGGGLALIVIAQVSFISCYVMLMVVARLQRFDPVQEEAALGLGASRVMVFRRVLLPFLRPALVAAGGLAVLQSIENYNTTLFVRGFETPLTVFIATKVRTGLTPAVNALALVMIAVAVLGAILYEIRRRRASGA
ncbi:ABC transporter permease [Falsirhodobacter halotolerans]|uniref:ABC transporter permease n=1 Tax=Falsirhodobacter halotolerans TaxID=1146892 RepID=UPI001FD042D9|nr:ABC transporter permease [Falsirhodobacter halotolerans]MCJ8141197.1 ABC transporter permease [Falsirhodobacter halotolerans]